MSAKSPRVSVMMSTYNTGELVHETIDAILAQEFEDWEFIIIDDCSTDDTFERVSSYDDPRIRVCRNETNQGISRTRNRALELARGDYLAATDHDDISLPGRLGTQVDYLDRHPEAVMVATAAKELRNGRLRSHYRGEMRSHILAWRLHTRCSIVHSSACFRRSTIKQHALCYRPAYRYAEDFVLFQELSRHGDLKILPEELVIYREMDCNASTQNSDEMGAHGIRFLHELYTNSLGIECSVEDVTLVWKLFNSGRSASSEQELLRAGMLYARMLDTFLRMHDFDHEQVGDIMEFASSDWWRAVGHYSSKNRRLRCGELYRAIPALSAESVSPLNSIKCSLKTVWNTCRPRN